VYNGKRYVWISRNKYFSQNFFTEIFQKKCSWKVIGRSTSSICREILERKIFLSQKLKLDGETERKMAEPEK